MNESGRLTRDEKAFIDTQGYLSLGKLLSDEQLSQLRNRIDELILEEGDQAGHELFNSRYIKHPKEEGADRLANLANKGAVFDLLYTHPKLIATVNHVLGPDVKLSSLNYRAARPGKGLQKLHVDWKEAVGPGEFKVCNSIWLLDDFSVANGATRLVPGSHLQGNLPTDEMNDPELPHPEEIILDAPAGTVVVFNSHTWHGGTTNTTDQSRRAIHSYFCVRDQPQQTPQREFILPETLERISEEARWLLDI